MATKPAIKKATATSDTHMHYHPPEHLTLKIVIAMGVGIVIGLLFKLFPNSKFVYDTLVDGILATGGTIFITIMKMLVVPIVFVSLVCGTTSLHDGKAIGRMGLKTMGLYLFTTALAITLALSFSALFHIGGDAHLTTNTHFISKPAPSLKEVFTGMFPSNPLEAMAKGDMLQIIVFSILFGAAVAFSGKPGKRVALYFNDLNSVFMKLIMMLLQVAPYGIFCLIANLFARMGFSVIFTLIEYFFTVLFVLFFHVILSNSLLLKVLGRLNPIIFFKKMWVTMLFAFSTSSSSASIPVVLNTVVERLGVSNSIGSFIVPLGATINMDGTAIMQGVATVFIANSYGISIGLTGFLTVILTATLASIGTAGVPGVGLITLTMVLQQVGLPVEGIALIVGVDRLLDMVRTAVNVTGDSAVACVVGKSEKKLKLQIYNDPDMD